MKTPQEQFDYIMRTVDAALPDGELMHVRIKGDRDPGYGSTSKMLAESAVCLALDEAAVGGGFWTPSTAMGARLLGRLTDNAGLSFEIEKR